MHKAIFDNTMKTLFSFARTRGVAFFLASLMTLFAVGCQRYTFPQVSPEQIGTIDEGGFKHKHFIVHAGNNLYDLVDLATNPKVFKGIVQPATEPIYYTTTRTEPYTNTEKSVVDEVHIYLNSRYDTLALGAITLPYVDIYDVRVINKTNSTGVIIAVVFGLGFLTLLAGLGLKSAFEGFHF